MYQPTLEPSSGYRDAYRATVDIEVGFRAAAESVPDPDTSIPEMGWRADAIERQLAHAESNKVRDAYTAAAQYLDERRKMMQAWADYLDGLREGTKVIPMHKKSAAGAK